MVFNSVMLASAAKTSAEVWQHLACLREEQRIDGQQMVDLVICFPLQQLGRLLLYLWNFLCVPPQLYYPTSISYYDDTSDDDGDDDASSSSTAFRYFYYQRGPDADADADADADDSSSHSD
ncbi:hypothetical protein ACH5RR_009145 [Cinchona calisaya]|uniref:Uncharacterized protein n=1 Tax=Cinchona calisaya TaxID=153742 RepID=A0ABD3AFB2_9GENT